MEVSRAVASGADGRPARKRTECGEAGLGEKREGKGGLQSVGEANWGEAGGRGGEAEGEMVVAKDGSEATVTSNM